MTSHIRVKDRNYLWKVVLDSVVILKETIENGKKDNGYCLTRQLQQRLCRAVRQCKGFTMAQKFEIHRVAEVHTHWDIPMPEQWIWQALGPVKTLTDESDVLEVCDIIYSFIIKHMLILTSTTWHSSTLSQLRSSPAMSNAAFPRTARRTHMSKFTTIHVGAPYASITHLTTRPSRWPRLLVSSSKPSKTACAV